MKLKMEAENEKRKCLNVTFKIKSNTLKDCQGVQL